MSDDLKLAIVLSFILTAGFFLGWMAKTKQLQRSWIDDLPKPNLLNIGRASIAKRSYRGSDWK